MKQKILILSLAIETILSKTNKKRVPSGPFFFIKNYTEKDLTEWVASFYPFFFQTQK